MTSPYERAERYRSIADEIRASASLTTFPESWLLLLSLADSYERRAAALEGKEMAEPERKLARA